MVWIIPSPVRCSSIVVIQHPLHSLEVSIQHLMQLDLALLLLDIKLKLGFIVVPLGLIGILLVGINKVRPQW